MTYSNLIFIVNGFKKALISMPALTAIFILATIFNPQVNFESRLSSEKRVDQYFASAKAINETNKLQRPGALSNMQTIETIDYAQNEYTKIPELQNAEEGQMLSEIQPTSSGRGGNTTADIIKPIGIKEFIGEIPKGEEERLAPHYIAGLGYACGGGYPANLCEATKDAFVDEWGMLNRECVSYAAFKVAESGRFMPNWGGHGDAKQWDENAIYEGLEVDRIPKAGDVAIYNGGEEGHAMYVESVNDDGTINISQYNARKDGLYSEATISPHGLVFIHF